VILSRKAIVVVFAANMALAGYDPLIPFDEVVDAARRVAGQQGGIQAIGLRELSHAAREVAHLPRIHDRDGEPRRHTRRGQQLVIPTRGLDDDEIRREWPELREQRGQSGCIIRHLPRGAALDGHVQRLRADINADVAHGLLTRS
jgi:hypothetical protein